MPRVISDFSCRFFFCFFFSCLLFCCLHLSSLFSSCGPFFSCPLSSRLFFSFPRSRNSQAAKPNSDYNVSFLTAKTGRKSKASKDVFGLKHLSKHRDCLCPLPSSASLESEIDRSSRAPFSDQSSGHIS